MNDMFSALYEKILLKKRLIAFLIIIVFVLLFYQFSRSIWYPVVLKIIGKKTVSEVISTYEASVHKKYLPLFSQAGVEYPPEQIALIAFKDTKLLELWVSDNNNEYKHIISYPIQAASGVTGPKLREGDRQVPEGLYKIVGFNPNSSYHLSMKINYPNEFDLKNARAEGRNQPGTDIFIHGRSVSIGCLAMGDSAIEELFTLVYETGMSNIQVLISPTDPSLNELVVSSHSPAWVSVLYKNITEEYIRITQKN